MNSTLSASVGLNGVNKSKDVTLVQDRLIWHKNWIHPIQLKTNGQYSKDLGEAISLFQKNACAMLKPDGRVDVNGFTLNRLGMHHIQKPKHALLNLNYCVNTASPSQSDFTTAANKLNCEPEAIQAVANIETKSSAFDSMGRPTILFERHYFRDLTSSQYNKSHPDLSGSQVATENSANNTQNLTEQLF